MNEQAERVGFNLAIETSGRLGGVALGRGPEIIEAATFSADMRHAVELLPTIDHLCRTHGAAPDDIAEVYVSGGPGSFTGLRIGITVARTLAFANGCRLVRVPTLDVIAQNALTLDVIRPNVAVILDAKRKKVYAAAFANRGDRFERTTEPAEVDPDEFFKSLPRDCTLTGEGIPSAREPIDRSRLTVLPKTTFRARPEIVYRLGQIRAATADYDAPHSLIPIYIRRPEAEEVWERRHGLSPRGGGEGQGC